MNCRLRLHVGVRVADVFISVLSLSQKSAIFASSLPEGAFLFCRQRRHLHDPQAQFMAQPIHDIVNSCNRRLQFIPLRQKSMDFAEIMHFPCYSPGFCADFVHMQITRGLAVLFVRRPESYAADGRKVCKASAEIDGFRGLWKQPEH